jgi:molybdopterin molybdotransferase
VRALVARLSGETWAPAPPVQVRSAFAYRKKSGRREFVRVTVRAAADGVVEGHKHPREGAGVITSLTESTGLVELPEDITQIAVGDLVGYRPFSEMF